MPLHEHYDVVIDGTGPAGLQAAIHAARKKVQILVLGKESKSSAYHAHIENFYCVFNIREEDLIATGREQARSFGAEFLAQDVLQLTNENQQFLIELEDDQRIESKSLIVAAGSQRNRLGVAGERELLGKGVSLCVECDANFFRDQTVAVAGGESAAVDGVLTLDHYSHKVHLAALELAISERLKDKLEQSDVQLHLGTAIGSIEGKHEVERVYLKDGQQLDITGAFIESGAKGLMTLALGLGVELDENMKYI
jgi:thioredoxin reductase (NADPH)